VLDTFLRREDAAEARMVSATTTERTMLDEESGLQACYGKPRKCGVFYVGLHHSWIAVRPSATARLLR
jgi:hypothetical protein